MRTYPLRTLVVLIAVMTMLLTNAAVAQDQVEIPQTQEACEASGRTWVPANAWDTGNPASCAPGANEEWGPGDTVGTRTAAAAESAPTESTPSVPLPQSLPATAQQGAPQYTG